MRAVNAVASHPAMKVGKNGLVATGRDAEEIDDGYPVLERFAHTPLALSRVSAHRVPARYESPSLGAIAASMRSSRDW